MGDSRADSRRAGFLKDQRCQTFACTRRGRRSDTPRRPVKPSAYSLERLRGLRLLARCPDGCTETVMISYGFSIDFLAGLVSDGLVTAELSTVRAGGRGGIVVWMRITEAGRKAV
jgi:hypothetical protein